MRINFIAKTTIVLSFIIGMFVSPLNGQNLKRLEFSYISPKPGSKFISTGHNIALRHGDVLNTRSIKDFTVDVNGSMSGEVEGKIEFSDDNTTIIFLPDNPFQPGERVLVSLGGSLLTQSGKMVSGNSFWFDITQNNPELYNDQFPKTDFGQYLPIKNQSKYTPKNVNTKDNNLPDDFPGLSAEVYNNPPENGYYFVSPFGYWGWFPDNIPYLIIFDNYATPVYYKKLPAHAYDFKKHSTGQLTHYLIDYPGSSFVELDSSYNIVREISMQQGHSTDFHESILLPNGHVIIGGYDPQIVDMSLLVPGGNPNAIVRGWILQELDTNDNVVFEWSSWDHFEITDAEGYEDLTAENIDPIHGNAIEPYGDDFWLLSSRNLNEITKISRNTGEIIWRMGGNNNMFQFINDTLGFSRQHDCRILDNGNLSLFDNGNDNTNNQYSSLVEYELDEENLTATLVNRFRTNPDAFGSIMGNVQKTDDNRYVTGWGSGVPGITEFTEIGEIATEYYFAGINYRAYRHNWETNRFYPEKDTLHFGYLWMEETRTKNIKVYNDQNEDLILTSYFSRTDYFSVDNEFPITIPTNGNITIQITLNPGEAGTYTDVITLNSDINTEELTQRIAQQFNVLGLATEGQGIGDTGPTSFNIYPNPVTDKLYIESLNEEQDIRLMLFDIFGKKVKDITLKKNETLDCSSLRKGTYLLKLIDSTTKTNSFVKIMKR